MSEPKEKPVGYKNPPHHSRFKPGQSGNPKGRPKKVAGPDPLARFLETEIAFSIGGKTLRISLREGMMRRVTEKGLKGDLKAAKLFFDVSNRVPASEIPEDGFEGGDPGAEIRRRFEKIIERRDALKAMGFDETS